MPPIIEDYADIKRRLNILEGRPDGRKVDELLDRIEDNLRRFKESMSGQQWGSGGHGNGGSIWSFTVGSGGGGDILSPDGQEFMKQRGASDAG